MNRADIRPYERAPLDQLEATAQYKSASRRRPHGIYLLINPCNHQPFYVGISVRLRARIREHASGSSFINLERREICEALRSGGHELSFVVIGHQPDAISAGRAEVFWIKVLLRSGMRLVNREVLPTARAKAVAFHLEAIEEATAAASRNASIKTLTSPTLSTATELAKPHALILPTQALELPASADRPTPRAPSKKKAARHGKPWENAELGKLVQAYLACTPIVEIAAEHERTHTSVLLKLRSLAANLPQVAQRLAEQGLLEDESKFEPRTPDFPFK